MGKTSKDKGRRGELAIARIISAWWVGDVSLLESKADELPIRRTPMSGGWAKGKGVGGDLVPVSEEAQDLVFSVEVKNREDWSFDGIIKDEKWPVWSWWSQCQGDASSSNLIPLLLLTKNYHPWYFSMKTKHWRDIRNKDITVMVYRGYVFGLLNDLVKIDVDTVKEAFGG